MHIPSTHIALVLEKKVLNYFGILHEQSCYLFSTTWWIISVYEQRKKARPGKSRPLLTYEKHQVQRYKKLSLLQQRLVPLDGFVTQPIFTGL